MTRLICVKAGLISIINIVSRRFVHERFVTLQIAQLLSHCETMHVHCVSVYCIAEMVIVRIFTMRKWFLTEAKPRLIIILEG